MNCLYVASLAFTDGSAHPPLSLLQPTCHMPLVEAAIAHQGPTVARLTQIKAHCLWAVEALEPLAADRICSAAVAPNANVHILSQRPGHKTGNV